MLAALIGTILDALRSTFTTSDGWLAAFAIRSTLWLLLAALGARLARTAAGRHGAWTAGLVGLIALPLASAWTPSWTLPVLPAAQVIDAAHTAEAIAPHHASALVSLGDPTPSSAARLSPAATRQGGVASREGVDVVGSTLRASAPVHTPIGALPESASPSVGFSLSRALLVLWAVGFAFLVARLGRDAVARARLVAKAEPLAAPSWLEDVEQAAQSVGARRRPSLFVSSEVPVPLTWGLFRSVLVVPTTALTWTEARRRSVLLHELAHIRRHDATWFLVGQIASAMAWFQPLAWWAVRRQRAESELSCDDRVVTGGVRASTYANELVTIARQARRDLPVAAASFARHSGVGERVRAILDGGRDRSGPSRWQAVLGVILASGLVLPALAAVVPGPRGEAWRGGGVSDGLDPAPAPDSDPAPTPDPAPTRVTTPVAPSGAMVAPSPAPSPVPLAEPSPRRAPRAPRAPGVPTTPAVPRGSGVPAVPAVASVPGVPSVPSSAPAVAPTPPVPSAPGVPGVPGVPSVPMMSEFLQGCGDANSTQISNDDGDWDITIKAGRCRFTLRLAGEVEFLGDESGIARMGRGATFSVEERRPGMRRELEAIAGPNGMPRFTWRVDRDERPFDDGARAWLAELIPTVFRATGIQAEERMARLIERGGVDAVFDEIALLRGDYVRRLYFSALIEATSLTDDQALRWIRSAGDTISSDYELGSVLRLLSSDRLENEDVQVAMVEAGRTIDSDYELRQMLTPLLVRDEVHPAALAVVVELAGEVQSDYELATLLVDLIERHRALRHADVRDAFVAVARTIDSDYELKRTLVAALGTRLDPAILAAVLDTAATIGSDYELASVLVEAAERQELAGPGRDAWERALATVGSDYERERARRAIR